MHINRFTRTAVLFFLALSPLAWCSSAHAQWVVEDPTNAALQIQQLIREAQEIDNQVQQIQNQVQSLQNQKNMLAHLNLSNAAQAIAAMQQIEQTLLQQCSAMQAQGASDRLGFAAGYNCGLIAQQLRAIYPAAQDWPAQSDPQIAAYPQQWTSQQSAAAAKAVQVQDASVSNMDATQQRMSELANASQSAPGQTAATQVTNQMLVTLSAQLRDEQAAALASQRSLALKRAQDAAEDSRNRELIARATRDAAIVYPVQPVSGPFSGN